MLVGNRRRIYKAAINSIDEELAFRAYVALVGAKIEGQRPNTTPWANSSSLLIILSM